MEDVYLQVNPAEIRFTQDSIGLYFRAPHHYFSIREAVRKLSKNEMRPDDFPSILVNRHNGCLWSVDNRRLWVFRFARCESVKVILMKKMHYRLQELIANSNVHMMTGKDFFPRVRHRGKIDMGFDLQFPQPSSFEAIKLHSSPQLFRNEAMKPRIMLYESVQTQMSSLEQSRRGDISKSPWNEEEKPPTDVPRRPERKDKPKEAVTFGKFIEEVVFKPVVNCIARLFKLW